MKIKNSNQRLREETQEEVGGEVGGEVKESDFDKSPFLRYHLQLPQLSL